MTTPKWMQVGYACHPKSQQLVRTGQWLLQLTKQKQDTGWTVVASLHVHKQILISATLQPINWLYFLTNYIRENMRAQQRRGAEREKESKREREKILSRLYAYDRAWCGVQSHGPGIMTWAEFKSQMLKTESPRRPSFYVLNSISSHGIIKHHTIYLLILLTYLFCCLSSPSKMKAPWGQGLVLVTAVSLVPWTVSGI